MQLKPFEAGRYDDDAIVVSNPENGKQELFTDREYAVVKFLKQNEMQSLLALLMPNIGIAKKNHIMMCLQVLGKLRRMQIADYFAITGRQPLSATTTMDVADSRVSFELSSLHSLATTVMGFGTRLLAPLGQAGLLALAVGLSVASLLLFPFAAADEALKTAAPAYPGMLLAAWLGGSLAFCFRTVLQGALLRSFGRDAGSAVFSLVPPFLALRADLRAIRLHGFRARAQLGVLGLIAPFAVSVLFALLAPLLGPVAAYSGFAACALVSLVLACPLFPFDGADIFQALLFRDELEQKLSVRILGIFQRRGPVARELQFALLLTVAWYFVWLDSIRQFRSGFSARMAEDITTGSLAARSGAIALALILVALFLLPPAFFLLHQLREASQRAKKRIVVDKSRLKESLSFEERIAALEKIPLFASLNDQERLVLLNEMQPAYYQHGAYLVHQGEQGREFFVLVKGSASAVYTDPKGKTMTLAELAEGDAFGEIALIDEVPRTASIVSEGGCLALILRKEGFDRFCETLGSPDRVKAMVRLSSFFRRHPLFSKLGARDQALLIDNFRFQTITSGEAVPGADDSFHVVYSGLIRVDTGGADGETTLASDDCFGYSNPLNARYVAVEGTGLLTVAKDEFHNLIWEKLVERPELFV